MQAKATPRRAPTRSSGGMAGLSRSSGRRANCLPCSLAALEEALEVAARLPAHFGAFAPAWPTSYPRPTPMAAALSAWCGAAGQGAEGSRWPPLCCSCSVMSGCYRSERVAPVRAGHWGPPVLPPRAFPSRARAAPSSIPSPSLTSLGSGGSQFLCQTLDPL